MSKRCKLTMRAATRLSYLVPDAVSLAFVATFDDEIRIIELQNTISRMESILVDMRAALANAKGCEPAAGGGKQAH